MKNYANRSVFIRFSCCLAVSGLLQQTFFKWQSYYSCYALRQYFAFALRVKSSAIFSSSAKTSYLSRRRVRASGSVPHMEFTISHPYSSEPCCIQGANQPDVQIVQRGKKMERAKRKWETGERAASPVYIQLLIFFSVFLSRHLSPAHRYLNTWNRLIQGYIHTIPDSFQCRHKKLQSQTRYSTITLLRIYDSPLQSSAQRCFAPLQKTRRNHRFFE